MNERVKFISRILEGDKMTDLCREFEISRKTGYKFWYRYLKEGLHGLENDSRKPSYCPHKTPKEIENLVVELRKTKPTWGPKKLKVRLQELYDGLKFPAASTIGSILEKNGLVIPRKRIRKKVYHPTKIKNSNLPNDIWCIDFKGEFKLKNGKYCYPLTVTDHYSRYLICCEALYSTKTDPVMIIFENLFKEYGVPKVILSDNGAPFAARGPTGLSRLSAWWVHLGIDLNRIEPGHPEQNGRHERFHLTLKEETTRPAASNLLSQQEKFDYFQFDYNNERPHEAIDMMTPSKLYQKSEIQYPKTLEKPLYPTHDTTCKVYCDGNIRLNSKRFYVSLSLQNNYVGLRQIDEHNWLVSFIDRDIGYIDSRMNKLIEQLPPKGGLKTSGMHL